MREWQAPDSWAGLLPAQHRIMTKEATQSYAKEHKRFFSLLSPSMQNGMAEGDAVSAMQYADAKKRKRMALAQLDEAWKTFDILLAPAAKGEAPAGLGNTGDPVFNRFWTLLGTPCIALPFNSGPFGLPLSVQLIGPPGQDDRLIAWARWVEQRPGVRIPPQLRWEVARRAGGVMSIIIAASDPSVASRRHFPFAASAKGRT